MTGRHMTGRRRSALLALGLIGCMALSRTGAAAPTGDGFPSPEDATSALLSAMLSGESWELEAVLGPGGAALLSSGNHAIDQEATRQFILAYAERHHFETTAPGHAVLRIGSRDWALPVPLVHDDSGWHFDISAARQVVDDRRIGRNELGAIRGLLSLNAAQLAYRNDPGGTGAYALKLVSTTGKHDGLFWPDATGLRSPLAQAADDARTRGRSLSAAELPYAFGGYKVKLLTSQGPEAPGGARVYLAGGELSDGFAYVAWPVTYGRTGVMTFLLGPDGHMFQKDLGPATEATVAHMAAFDPDLSWALLRLVN